MKTPLLSQRRGFALVLAISIMAFIVLLLVSLSTLLRVETQGAQNAAKQELARQNALMALNIAIGELQKNVGPDQRVTATAEILDERETVHPSNRYWTGVWKTEGDNILDYGETSDTTKRNSDGITEQTPQWLVSANIDPTDELDISRAIEDQSKINGKPEVVTLVKEGTYNPSPSNPVTVPDSTVRAGKVPIKSFQGNLERTTGHYAYWVGDEGVKAKVTTRNRNVDLFNPDADSHQESLDTNRRNLLQQLAIAGPQKFGVELIEGAEDFKVNDPLIDKILTLNQIPSLEWSSGSGELDKNWLLKNFQNITTYSYGVLSDVTNGGLKIDLTRGLDDQWNEFLETLDPDSPKVAYEGVNWSWPQPIYKVPGPSGYSSPNNLTYDGNLYGPYWDVIFHHYNLYKPWVPYLPRIQRAPDGAFTPWGYSKVGRDDTFMGYVVGDDATDALVGEESREGIQTLGLLDPSIEGRTAGRPYNGSGTTFDGCIPQSIDWFAEVKGISKEVTKFNRIDPIQDTKQGIVTQGQMIISLSVTQVANPVNASKPSYKFKIHYRPIFSFYNPYDVALKIEEQNFRILIAQGFDIFVNNITIFAAGDNNNFGTYDPALGKALYYINRCGIGPAGTFAGNDGQSPPLAEVDTFTRDSLTIPPGEIRIFCAEGNSDANKISARVMLDNTYNLENGVSVTVGGGTEAILKQAFRAGFPSAEYEPNKNLPVKFKIFPSQSIRAANTSITKTYFDVQGGSINKAHIVREAQTVEVGSIADLKDKPVDCFMYSWKLKTTEETPDNNIALFSQWNVRPLIQNIGYSNAELMMADTHEAKFIYKGGPDNFDEYYVQGDGVNGYWGASHGPSAERRVILFGTPRQPLHSLGDLMHTNLSYFHTMPTYSIGSSFNSPSLNLNEYYRIWSREGDDEGVYASGNTMLVDWSYLLNQAIFDKYYFSTVPTDYEYYKKTGGNNPYKETEIQNMEKNLPPFVDFNSSYTFANYVSENRPLPNSTMKYYFPEGEVADDTYSESLHDLKKASGRLLVDGAFNINSISENAWKAFLGSLSLGEDEEININDAASGPRTLSKDNMEYAFPRFQVPRGTSREKWYGFKSLSEDQIKKLAEAIVKQVKLRGPFLSLGDFVNRRLTNNKDLGLSGTLQTAIDETDINQDLLSGVNKIVNSGDFETSPYNQSPVLDISRVNSPVVGIPGWLLQNDILRSLAPLMTVRSDTFRIRAYGDAVNPVTGETEGKAWCEAIVQRVPEFVEHKKSAASGGVTNTGDFPETRLDELESDSNKTFGRKFKILSLRWLAPEDV